MKNTKIFCWLKQIVIRPKTTNVVTLGQDVFMPAPSRGKSPFGDAIDKAMAMCSALPGDIVEVDERGKARVVGRRPRVAGEINDMSEQAIRVRLRAIYGAEVASMVDVSAGMNIVVFSTSNRS